MQEPEATSRDTTRVLAALSDDNRFRIVELLAEEGEELSCGAIGKALDLSPSLLSHHLAILSEAGLIGRRKNGLWTMNALERPVIQRQVEVLQGLLNGNGASANGAGHNGAEVEEAAKAPAGGAGDEPGRGLSDPIAAS